MSLKDLFGSGRHASRKYNRDKRAFPFETLEKRELMAGDFETSFNGAEVDFTHGTLTVGAPSSQSEAKFAVVVNQGNAQSPTVKIHDQMLPSFDIDERGGFVIEKWFHNLVGNGS